MYVNVPLDYSNVNDDRSLLNTELESIIYNSGMSGFYKRFRSK